MTDKENARLRIDPGPSTPEEEETALLAKLAAIISDRSLTTVVRQLERANNPATRCAKCGRRRDSHNVRHPFAEFGL
jgi:hypothetical protein